MLRPDPRSTTHHLRRHGLIALVTVGLILSSGAAARAQYVVKPFKGLGIFRGSIYLDRNSLDVAVANDGRAVVVWSDYKIVKSHLDDPIVGIAPFSLATLTATFPTTWMPIRLFSNPRPRITALADGGLLTTWLDGKFSGVSLSAQRLNRAGLPDGDAQEDISQVGSSAIIGYHSSAALPSGVVVVAWQEFRTFRFARLDASGRPLGSPISLDSAPFDPAGRIEVDALHDGGFVVAWQQPEGNVPRAQHFTAAGQPVDVYFTISSQPFLQALAASPAGDVVAALFWRGATDVETAPELWLGRFTSDGVPLGPELRVNGSGEQGVVGDLEFDVAGNLYVVWNGNSGVRARGYDAGGTPLGPPVQISGPTYGTVRAARIPEGDFVTVFSNPGANVGVVSLCTPGTSVCGDGVLDALCERCDAGPANSDTLPDACRTNCRPARCGDGTIDTGETCDDANREDCDGCSLTCQEEVGLGCGDAIPFPTCGETCDDGNDDVGDGCSPTCTPERARGGGSINTDCYIEWSIDNPTNTPLLDKEGRFANVQRCRDNDALCDRDGGVGGSCTFALRVCVNNTDVPQCEPALRLSSWTLKTPSEKQGLKDPVAADIRAAFAGTVNGAIVGTTLRDVCSPEVLVPVAVRPGTSAGKRKLTSQATLYSGARDGDKIQLICVP